MPSKSPLCIGRSFASAFLLCISVFDTIISRTALIRSPSKNICSVRTSPIPSAPNFTACAASFGVSAFVRTFNLRVSSAHVIKRSKSPEISAGTVLIGSPYTLPLEPSSEI